MYRKPRKIDLKNIYYIIIQSMEVENPYNVNNKLINENYVKKILSKYNVDIKVNNINNFINAFTHKSYMRSTYTLSNNELDKMKNSIANEILELRNNCYEELEFFGDSILDFVTVLYITDRFPNQSEGFYTKLKSKIVNGASLSKLAKKLDFHQFLLISLQVEEKFGRFSDKILEDIFEAFIGALFRDQDNKHKSFTVCYEFIYNILNNTQDDFDYAELILYDSNYKDQLLKYYNNNKLGHPIYKEISVEESTNMKIFTIGIVDPSNPLNYISTAVGSTKKKAEQLSAKDALRKFGILVENI